MKESSLAFLLGTPRFFTGDPVKLLQHQTVFQQFFLFFFIKRFLTVFFVLKVSLCLLPECPNVCSLENCCFSNYANILVLCQRAGEHSRGVLLRVYPPVLCQDFCPVVPIEDLPADNALLQSL